MSKCKLLVKTNFTEKGARKYLNFHTVPKVTKWRLKIWGRNGPWHASYFLFNQSTLSSEKYLHLFLAFFPKKVLILRVSFRSFSQTSQLFSWNPFHYTNNIIVMRINTWNVDLKFKNFKKFGSVFTQILKALTP